ncbi:MAG: hypothetical protein ACYCX3_01480 [Thermoleophilia bacterium]
MTQHDKTITIEVDNETYQVTKKTMAAADILRLVGKDPSIAYLVEVNGRHQDSYKDRPEAEVKLHNQSKFITAATGPTPVSDQ